MTPQTILVIDDSATIRKLVDSHLTQEGYRVYLAPTAEQGLELARQVQPDLILLDHQLPGTTGIEVCRKIIQFPECARTPFVISSTLRQQAYAEYMAVPNVVDSLHKPFKPELLKMTVSNALETAAMIVSSQTQGTAVPEVIDEMEKGALSGEFQFFTLREILDFLNNSNKRGMLEVEAEHDRIWFYLAEGRIQCVASASFQESEVARRLPENLKELGPLLRFTMSTGFSSQVEGLVDLMDKKVLDPRMLRALLRHQAAVLTKHCFRSSLKGFTFVADRPLPPLFRRTPLETSLAALLVEGALVSPPEELSDDDGLSWMRHALRGQCLDRSGLSPRHVQLLSALDAPLTSGRLAERLDSSIDEIRRVLEGFRLADWVRSETVNEKREVLVLEPDPEGSALLRQLLTRETGDWSGKVVRDLFGLQLLLKRMTPDVILIAVEDEEQSRLLTSLESESARVCVILPQTAEEPPHHPVLRRPYSEEDVLRCLDQAGEPSTADLVLN